MSIDQIYCTRSGDSPSHLGSDDAQGAEPTLRPRASSLEGEALRRCCEAIRPYADYRLPPDTSQQQRRELTAATAPQRLFFLPGVNGFQVLGRACYRPAGAEGAAEGCFVHVLLRRPAELRRPTGPLAETQLQQDDQDVLREGGEDRDAATADTGPSDLDEFREEAVADLAAGEPQPSVSGAAGAPPAESETDWSILDGLRLWGAPGWVAQDSAAIAAAPPILESLADLLGGKEPAIDDAVFWSFLKDAGGDPRFHDPAGIVPQRWRTMEPELRQRWFAHLFCRFLRPEAAERRPVLVVAEPSVAALLFYGVGRLLPAGPLRDGISFSTFETDPERIPTALAATWFSNPQALGAWEGMAWPGLLNTLAEFPPEDHEPKGHYVGCIVQLLCEQGWKAVDDELAALASQEVGQCGELESLLAVQRAVTTLLESGSFPNEGWRNSAAAMRYLRQELVRRVAAMADPAQGLRAVVGGPSHLAVIDLLTAKPTLHGTRKAVIHLLSQLPSPKILGLLKLSGVPDEDKVTVLGRYIHGSGDLPLGCEFLWDDFSATGEGPRRPGAVLMGRVLARLPTKDLKKLYRNATRESAVGFVLNVLRLHKHNRLKVESLSAVVQAMDEATVVEWLRAAGAETLRSYPEGEPALGEKIAELLHTLPRHPQEFKPRLDLILAGQRLLPDEQHREAAAAWETCYHLIHKASGFQKSESGANPQMRIPLLVNTCRDLAKAADQAMSLEVVEQHMTWNQKRDALLRIGHEVLGGIPLLLKGPWEHDAILERIGTQLHHHRWPTEPLKKEASAKKEPPPRKLTGPESKSMATTGWGLMIGMVVVVLAFSALILGLGYWMFFGGSGGEKTREKSRRERKRERQVSIPADGSGLAQDRSRSGRDAASAASPPPAADVTARLLQRLPEWIDRHREAAWEPPGLPPRGRELQG